VVIPKNIKRATKRTVLRDTEACCFDFKVLQGVYEETSEESKERLRFRLNFEGDIFTVNFLLYYPLGIISINLDVLSLNLKI